MNKFRWKSPWLLPLLWLVVVTVTHFILNVHYERMAADKSHGRELFTARDGVYEREANEIIRHTGSWLWRFFHWGTLEGDITADTVFGYWLRDNLHMDAVTASAWDVTNPTPAMVFFLLALVALGYSVRKAGANASAT